MSAGARDAKARDRVDRRVIGALGDLCADLMLSLRARYKYS
jgi:hypothetical protein